MKLKKSELFVTYCLISITFDISKKRHPFLTIFSCKWQNSHLGWTQNLTFLLHADKKTGYKEEKQQKSRLADD